MPQALISIFKIEFWVVTAIRTVAPVAATLGSTLRRPQTALLVSSDRNRADMEHTLSEKLGVCFLSTYYGGVLLEHLPVRDIKVQPAVNEGTRDECPHTNRA